MEEKISATNIGIEISFNDEHPQNEEGPIFATEEAIETCLNDEQPLKAPCPISFTEDGIVICDSLLQPIKHFGGMMLSGWDNKRLIIS